MRSFRAANVLAAGMLAVAAIRLLPGPGGPALGGAAIGLVALASVTHRALSPLRREGTASRLVSRVRLLVEAIGLSLSGVALALLLSGRDLPVRLAFWSLFLLRLSIADLIDPSRLAAGTGLTRSAARDVKSAMGRSGRSPRPARRLRRALSGAAKASLLALWLALPLAAALAPGEVAAGTWPEAALLLRWYPPPPSRSRRSSSWARRRARRGRAGSSTPCAARPSASGPPPGSASPSATRPSRPRAARSAGLVLAETVAGFLFGAAARGR